MSSQSESRLNKQQYWKEHVLSWKRSGLSQSEYCRRNDLNSRVFGYWKRKLLSLEDNSSFIELSVGAGPNPSSGIIELMITDGTLLRCREDVSAINLQNILRALRG